MMRSSVRRLVLAMASLAGLFGCDVGGGPVPPNSRPPESTPTPAPVPIASPVLSNAQLTFTVHAPPGGPDASIVIRLTRVAPTNGATYGGPLNVDLLVVLSAANANCMAAADGSETCVVTETVPGPATDTFAVYSFATSSPIVGTTTPISVYVGLALPIALGVVNTASVSTSGVPASIAFSPASGQAVTNFPLSGSTALVTSVQARDASGATIIGNANFATPAGAPVSVTFNGCDAHLAATPPSSTSGNAIALGANTIGIAFDGTSASGTTLRCSASATGGLTANYLFNVTTGSSGVGFVVSMSPAFDLPFARNVR